MSWHSHGPQKLQSHRVAGNPADPTPTPVALPTNDETVKAFGEREFYLSEIELERLKRFTRT